MHNLGKREERGIGKVLIVIDMQNDFVTGTLGNQEAQAIVPNVQAKVKEYADRGDWIILTRDTHEENYLDTPEGKKLPVKHCAAFGNSGILVFVDVVGVLAALGGKVAVFPGAFQFFVQKRILSGNIQLSVSVNRQNKPCGTLDQIVAAHVQVGKRQLAVPDLGGGHKSVFLQNGQVIGIPAAIGEDSGVPNGRAVGIGDFGIIHHTRNTVRVFNGVSGVQIVHSTFQRGISVADRSQIPRGVQINFCQQNIAENTVILHLVGIGVLKIAIRLFIRLVSAVLHTRKCIP